MRKSIILVVLAFLSINQWVWSQSQYFSNISLTIENNRYFYNTDTILFQGEMHLAFIYHTNDAIALINLYPKPTGKQIKSLTMLPSDEYELQDSVYLIDNKYFQARVKFNDLNESKFLKVLLNVVLENEESVVIPLSLLPYTNTFAELRTEDNQLYIGEERTFEISSNNFQNIKATNKWIKGDNIEYKTTYDNGKLLLHVLPHRTGGFIVELPLELKSPYINENKVISFNLPPIQQAFVARPSRLRFLEIDAKEVQLTSPDKQQVSVQIQSNSGLQLNKTYRIENQEEPGGELVGELFVRRYLTNNKMLAWLRTYKYHDQSDGYLYIKDGDVSEFITNLSIIPQTSIEKIQILREGKDWDSNLTVFPGETIEVKVEGKSLHKASFKFPVAEILASDTVNNNPKQTVFTLRIPLNILERKINIMNGIDPTDFSLNVKEYQRPRTFDFLTVNFGERDVAVSEINKPILYENTIQDVVIDYIANLIDQNGTPLYGKQIIDVDIKITNKQNELLEIQKIEGLTYCPGETSPRYSYYRSSDCRENPFLLNQVLRKKTYDLPEWSKIELQFKHQKSKYGGEGFEKTIEIYNKRLYAFDIEVSFPAGLIEISKPDEGSDKVGNLTGISMAALAQFSFYHKEKIARFLPYKVGIGFLAINAFDFNANESQRDLGVVILGSLYPTTKDVKLTFPLYVGGGYYLNKERLFFVIGPGIRLRL